MLLDLQMIVINMYGGDQENWVTVNVYSRGEHFILPSGSHEKLYFYTGAALHNKAHH